MFFVRETRRKVARDMPDIAPLDIMKEVGKIWKKVSELNMKRYKALADQDALRY